MDIGSIRPYPKNAKKHPAKQVEQIAASIREFGFNQPIVVDQYDVIIVGHGRYEAAKILGLKEIPVLKLNVTEEQAKAYRLADNKLNESDWDMGLAIEDLKTLSDQLFDLTGFDRDLLIDPNELDDVIPENVPSKSKRGDLYELGRHRVLCGDSTKKDEVEKLMDGKKADLFITDPPYGVSYADKNKSLNAISTANRIQTPIENDHLTVDEMKSIWTTSFSNAHEAVVDSGCYYINAMQGGDLMMMMMMMSILESGWNLKHMMIWIKNNHVLGRMDYHYQHEPIFYGWKEGKSHKWFGGHSQTSVWKVDKPLKSNLHPTMKPVELVCKPIFNSSERDDVILDLFLGSGSTLIACEKTNRICYGMEIDPHYTDVIVQRYVDYVNNPQVKLNGKVIEWQKTPKTRAPIKTLTSV